MRFFLDLHNAVRIKEVMSSEEIYLVTQQGNIIGTGSIRKNEICRLMDLLETRIFENYPKVHVDASFPAESMYLKRGIRKE